MSAEPLGPSDAGLRLPVIPKSVVGAPDPDP